MIINDVLIYISDICFVQIWVESEFRYQSYEPFYLTVCRRVRSTSKSL